ncbi:MAG: chromosome segregation protein SMC [Clostridia bacterium]
MHFKQIEIAGFKSFADRTEIKFDNGVTAIVGPNGCGKSNVADSIRWVLGEQSSKLLRGSSMQDVIFNGTEKRKSLSFTEVTLCFDNADRFFDLDYNEVAITRKLYRSGESEYLINRTPCRLKDIIDLLYDSGLGRDGYSIIGQGKVEEIISAKPENRRAIFEEASGISKFKSRKIEAERKLERTKDNLTRLSDIISEIERQIEPLQKQSDAAKKYLDLKAQLKDLEINAYVYQYENATEIKEKLRARLEKVLEEENLLDEQLDSTINNYGKNMAEIGEIDKTINKFHSDVLSLTVGIEKQSSEIKLIRERINFLKEQNDRVNRDIEISKSDIEKATQDIAIKGNLITEKSNLLKELNCKSDKIANDYLKVIDDLALSEDEAEENQKNMIDFLEKISSLKANLSSLEAEKKMLVSLGNDEEKVTNELKNKIENQNNLICENKRLLVEREKSKDEIIISLAKSEQDRTVLVQKQRQSIEDKHTINSKIQVFENRKRLLEEMQAEYEGYAGSVRKLLRDAEKNSELKSKIVGVVASLISVPEMYETAIEVALGGAVQNIITFNEKNAQDLIGYLKTAQAGRATFLPISSMKSRNLSSYDKQKISISGCFGVASELVSFDKQIENVISNLLGSIVVVDNLDTAVSLAKNSSYSFKIVTLDGDVVNPQGSYTGGSKKSEATNLISRDREIETLGKELNRLKEALNIETQNLSSLQTEFSKNEENSLSLSRKKSSIEIELAKENEKLKTLELSFDELNKNLNSHNKQKEQIFQKISLIDNQLKSVDELETSANTSKLKASSKKVERKELSLELKNKKEEYNAEATTLKVQIAQIEGEITALTNEKERLEMVVSQLQKSLQEHESAYSRNNQTIIGAESIIASLLAVPANEDASKKLEEIKIKQVEIEKRKATLQDELKILEDKRSALTEEKDKVNNKKLQEEVSLSKVDTDMEVMQEKIFEDYSLTYSTCLEFKRPDFIIEKGTIEIGKIKNSIQRLGNINVNAIEDFKMLDERHKNLFDQAQDLTKAQEDLEKIIKDLSSEMTTKFETEFTKINENFKKIFKELFGGGNARLELVNSENMLEAGVEIFAEPPGKKLQSITLLSGGEKALTAIAILFSILKLKPMPFCLLDEIEAALDDANAERFAQYLRRFSNETQFIVITHRKPTMELADSLFGVTMEEKGVSKMVSVKLADAVQNAKVV